MPEARREPVAHRRQLDRAHLVQVVRPVGRSTWTRRTRPSRAGACATGCPHRSATPTSGRNLGDDLATTPDGHHRRPTRIMPTSRPYSQTARPDHDPCLIRDKVSCQGDHRWRFCTRSSYPAVGGGGLRWVSRAVREGQHVALVDTGRRGCCWLRARRGLRPPATPTQHGPRRRRDPA